MLDEQIVVPPGSLQDMDEFHLILEYKAGTKKNRLQTLRELLLLTKSLQADKMCNTTVVFGLLVCP